MSVRSAVTVVLRRSAQLGQATVDEVANCGDGGVEHLADLGVAPAVDMGEDDRDPLTLVQAGQQVLEAHGGVADVGAVLSREGRRVAPPQLAPGRCLPDAEQVPRPVGHLAYAVPV